MVSHLQSKRQQVAGLPYRLTLLGQCLHVNHAFSCLANAVTRAGQILVTSRYMGQGLALRCDHEHHVHRWVV